MNTFQSQSPAMPEHVRKEIPKPCGTERYNYTAGSTSMRLLR